MDYVAAVKEFMEKHGQQIPTSIDLRTWELRDLRSTLILEESDETCVELLDPALADVIKVADGICDSIYVLVGTALALGFADKLDACFAEVHRSNMTKDVAETNGKVQKGANFQPPDLQSILYP